MKIQFQLTLFLSIVCFCFVKAQKIKYQRNSVIENTTNTAAFNPELKPFYHGVASGDPLEDRVIIWTRITPEDENPIEVSWYVATDASFSSIVRSGTAITNSTVDYTIKVDVDGLAPATTYYYYFQTAEANSLIGRTRTTPSAVADQLRFAVVSCSNYQAGYFNAYKKIAERKDLDAVIHLGDYIYEYGAGEGTYGYDESRADRINEPANEILSLIDYRTRYSLYRLDPDLLAAHQQHPFIAIWDDHESANDSYKDGAENHGENGSDEGSWEDRKAISKQVYFEWMPIRNEANLKINRTIHYGNLADIINIDTRLEGRDEQINDVTDPLLYASDRTLLGEDQKNWLFNELQTSTATWKIIANQVIFSEFNVGWAAQSPQTPEQLESVFLDIWDGYPAERDLLIDYIETNNINNTVILTGDFHSTFAFDVSKRPSMFSPGAPDSITYDAETGIGSVAVEFATPSITSANFDENIGAEASAGIEYQINKEIPSNGINPNPHMKYNDLDQHGYFILDLTANKAQADWFYVNILDASDNTETLGEHWYTEDSQNRLLSAAMPSAEKTNQPELAPLEVPAFNLGIEEVETQATAIFSIYPNPIYTDNKNLTIQYGIHKTTSLAVDVYDLDGKRIVRLIENDKVTPGIYLETYSLSSLTTGTYFIKIVSDLTMITRKVVVY
ncbi:hypothetical protein GCM10022393_09240 [Aquimarina addita]|uniref:Phosphodiesterase n=1 Tax=Aquimarina addita TaxID=870485 RepID=A0ABP7XCF8_9FLAO